jgi:hypothetical protein
MESLTREEKEQRWLKMAARMDKLADGLGMPIDTGIKDTVIVLNLLRFPTTMSCEGHAFRGVHGPWVDIKPSHLEALEKKWRKANQAVNTAASKKKRPLPKKLYKTRNKAKKKLDTPVLQLATRLMAYLTEFYAERVVPHDQVLVLFEFASEFRLQCHGAFLQKIVEPDERYVKLKEYQEEMRAFTAYLKARYFAS